MKRNSVAVFLFSLMLLQSSGLSAQTGNRLSRLWYNPSSDYRMKTWWFFGYEHTTDEGIKADVASLRDAGFGGVVYYDQNHAKDPVGNGAEDAFSPSWWRHLKLAAGEAHQAGLSFELNISNGYCAGGKWIDAEHAMQRVASAETTVKGGRGVAMPLPVIVGRDGYVRDIALLAFPARLAERACASSGHHNGLTRRRLAELDTADASRVQQSQRV